MLPRSNALVKTTKIVREILGNSAKWACFMLPLFFIHSHYIRVRTVGVDRIHKISMAYPPGSEFTQLFYSRAYGNFLGTFYLHQFSSVAQSCPAPCDPINRSTPSLPVCHQLPEFTQTHVHSVGDAIQASHPLSSPSPPASSSIRVFSNESTLHIRWPKYWSSALASVLPMNIQD